MNLPNTLTVLRLVLTVIFIAFMLNGGFAATGWGVVVFTLAAVTDFLDGYYAKKHNQITAFGKIMDPIADKFLTLSALFILTLYLIVPLWMFLVIAAREVVVTVARLIFLSKGEVLAAEQAGKMKTVVQMATIIVCLCYVLIHAAREAVGFWPGFHGLPSFWMGSMIAWLIWLTLILTVYSGVTFFLGNRRLFRV